MRSRFSLWLLVATAGGIAIVAWRVRFWQRISRRGVASVPEGPAALENYNREFYEALWRRSRLVPPQRFNTWPIVRRWHASSSSRLEIGAGLRPRLPLDGTDFVDLSEAAVAKLRAAGGRAVVGTVTNLPGAADAYDLICALDILEHVDDDEMALAEMARVLRPGGCLLLSVPLHAGRWIAFDDVVGHRRRYEPAELREKLARHGFEVESSAPYGMQPRSSRLLDFGMSCLQHRRERSMWFYSNVFMPISLWMAPELRFEKGFAASALADEALLVCRISLI